MLLRAEQKLKIHELTEEETIQLAQQGNAAAFEQLYRRYSPRVYALCLRIVKNDQRSRGLDSRSFLTAIPQDPHISRRIGIFHLAAPASHQCCAYEAA